MISRACGNPSYYVLAVGNICHLLIIFTKGMDITVTVFME